MCDVRAVSLRCWPRVRSRSRSQAACTSRTAWQLRWWMGSKLWTVDLRTCVCPVPSWFFLPLEAWILVGAQTVPRLHPAASPALPDRIPRAIPQVPTSRSCSRTSLPSLIVRPHLGIQIRHPMSILTGSLAFGDLVSNRDGVTCLPCPVFLPSAMLHRSRGG